MEFFSQRPRGQNKNNLPDLFQGVVIQWQQREHAVSSPPPQGVAGGGGGESVPRVWQAPEEQGCPQKTRKNSSFREGVKYK